MLNFMDSLKTGLRKFRGLSVLFLFFCMLGITSFTKGQTYVEGGFPRQTWNGNYKLVTFANGWNQNHVWMGIMAGTKKFLFNQYNYDPSNDATSLSYLVPIGFSEVTIFAAGKTATFNGTANFNDNITLASGKTATFNGTANFNDDITLAAGKYMTFNGSAVFNHHVSFSVGKQANFYGVAGFHENTTFAASKTATFNGITAFNDNATFAASKTATFNGITAFNDNATFAAAKTATFNGAAKFNAQIRIKDAIVKDLNVQPGMTWSDFVFEADYSLRSLEEVHDFINENGHLPDVPSAEEVDANGYNMAKMDALLLQKIEELTLYVISLKATNEQLKAQLDSQER